MRVSSQPSPKWLVLCLANKHYKTRHFEWHGREQDVTLIKKAALKLETYATQDSLIESVQHGSGVLSSTLHACSTSRTAHIGQSLKHYGSTPSLVLDRKRTDHHSPTIDEEAKYNLVEAQQLLDAFTDLCECLPLAAVLNRICALPEVACAIHTCCLHCIVQQLSSQLLKFSGDAWWCMAACRGVGWVAEQCDCRKLATS
eukprot:3199332-Amphidinium_carterae.2